MKINGTILLSDNYRENTTIDTHTNRTPFHKVTQETDLYHLHESAKTHLLSCAGKTKESKWHERNEYFDLNNL